METKTDYAVSQPSDFLSSTSSVIEGLGCRCGDDFRQVQNGWQKVSHFLVDSDNLTNLQLPVGASSRIKVVYSYALRFKF
jgi:hypothetical protein